MAAATAAATVYGRRTPPMPKSVEPKSGPRTSPSEFPAMHHAVALIPATGPSEAASARPKDHTVCETPPATSRQRSSTLYTGSTACAAAHAVIATAHAAIRKRKRRSLRGTRRRLSTSTRPLPTKSAAYDVEASSIEIDAALCPAALRCCGKNGSGNA